MKSNSGNLKAVANIAQNKLYITIGGKLTKENLDKLYTDIRFCVADLTPGFDVINDLSDCKLAALSGIPTFRKITNHLVTKRVGRVVRVIDKSKIVFRQILNFAARIQCYSVIYVNTLEEAETILIKTQQRDGLRFYLHSQKVKYKIGETEGEGHLHDISTSGCAINSATLLPVVDDSISFSTKFNKQENLIENFETLARVIWIKDNNFAITFDDLDVDHKNQLWERLVHESNSEISA